MSITILIRERPLNSSKVAQNRTEPLLANDVCASVGGQRQRIGIARALCKKISVLIFDEATNALDHDTENSVMSAINELDQDLTILIIAHRMTTLEGCHQVFEFKKSGELIIRRS